MRDDIAPDASRVVGITRLLVTPNAKAYVDTANVWSAELYLADGVR